MKKTCRILLMLTLFLLLIGSYIDKSHALLLNLDCVLTNNGCTPGANFGTLSITDNGMMVDLTIDLVNTSVGNPHKIQSVYLNYTNFPIIGVIDTVSPAGIVVSQDAAKANGYSGYFDLRIPDPPPGNLGFDPYTDHIMLAGTDLDPSYFDALDTLGNIFAAVHIGNYGNAPGVGGGNSIWVGATKGVPPPPPTIPEPGTMLLLGSGLLGYGIYGRKKFKK